MNYRKLSDAEIYSIVDQEISAGKLNAACEAEASKEANGNFDLMISRYFLIRVERLSQRQVPVEDKASALDERKRAAATQRIRYRSTATKGNSLKRKEKKMVTLTVLFGNLILAISTVGAILAFMVLKGNKLSDISYIAPAGVVAIIMCFPFVISKLKVSSFKMPYQTVLMSVCALMCLSSAASGLLLMKKDPPVYASSEKKEKATPASVNIAPASTADSVVQNP